MCILTVQSDYTSHLSSLVILYTRDHPLYSISLDIVSHFLDLCTFYHFCFNKPFGFSEMMKKPPSIHPVLIRIKATKKVTLSFHLRLVTNCPAHFSSSFY